MDVDFVISLRDVVVHAVLVRVEVLLFATDGAVQVATIGVAADEAGPCVWSRHRAIAKGKRLPSFEMDHQASDKEKQAPRSAMVFVFIMFIRRLGRLARFIARPRRAGA